MQSRPNLEQKRSTIKNDFQHQHHRNPSPFDEMIIIVELKKRPPRSPFRLQARDILSIYRFGSSYH